MGQELEKTKDEVDIGEIVVPVLRMPIAKMVEQCADLARTDPLERRVQSRFADVYAQLRGSSAQRPDGFPTADTVARFCSLVIRLLRFLKQAAPSVASSQIGVHRRSSVVIFSIHTDIDRLLESPGLSKSSKVHAWQQEWDVMYASHRSELRLKAMALSVPIGIATSDEDKAFTEFEMTRFGALNARHLPRWFVPPYEVAVRSIGAFGQGSFG